MNNIPWHLVIFVVAILFSAAQGILRKMKQANEARKLEEASRQHQESQLRSGHLAPSAAQNTPPAPIDHATAAQRLREIAQRRQAQLEELRRRAAQRASAQAPVPTNTPATSRPPASEEFAASAPSNARPSFPLARKAPIGSPYPPSQRTSQPGRASFPPSAAPASKPAQRQRPPRQGGPRQTPQRQEPTPQFPAARGPQPSAPSEPRSGSDPRQPDASPFASTPAAGAHWENEHETVHRLVPDDDTVHGRLSQEPRAATGAAKRAAAAGASRSPLSASAQVPRSPAEWRRALIAMEVLSPPPALRAPAQEPADIALLGLPPPPSTSGRM